MKLKLKDVDDLITVRLALEFWKEESNKLPTDAVMAEEVNICIRLLRQCYKKEKKYGPGASKSAL